MKLPGRGKLQRGVLILPSLCTLGNLFCGFSALREAMAGAHNDAAFERSAILIIIAIVLDGLDGRIARLAHAESALGIQLDSLADVVSFGVAPGLLVYQWALVDLGNLGWAVAFSFTSCGAIRLARFNVQTSTSDPSFFRGLPIPAAAGAIAGSVFLYPFAVESAVMAVVVAVSTVVLGLLMVSTIRYRSFKRVEAAKPRPVRALLWVLLVIAVVSTHPQAAIVSAAMLYALSGPAMQTLSLYRKTTASGERQRRPADELR